MAMVRERVPELMEIGVPYVKRYSAGKGELGFILHCPIAGADDSLMRNYYEIGSGYADGDGPPVFWYRIFIGKDMQTMLIGEFGIPAQPVETVRSSEKWKREWQERR